MDFLDKETMTAELAAATCKRCGHIGGSMRVVLDLTPPHFARVDCKNCGAFIDWVRWPTAAPRKDRRRSRKRLRDLGDRCEICLRHRDDLPAPEQLEVHHVLEVAADDGTDDQENLRVYCSACHAIVNWLRTYFGHYHPEFAVSASDGDGDDEWHSGDLIT
jgi:HNH endonuclease